jgi:hypothetical protein
LNVVLPLVLATFDESNAAPGEGRAAAATR